MTVEETFPVGAVVRQEGYEPLFEVVGIWRGQPRLRHPQTDTTHVASPSVLEVVERDEWPTHQPEAYDAPIPGRQWYGGCDPDRPLVNPATGVCESCGRSACGVCGRENCPDHGEASR